MAVETRTLLTGEDLLRMGDIGRCELVRGELIALAPAGDGHGRKTIRTGAVIFNFVEEHDLGTVHGAETGFYLSRDPDTVRAADAMFYSKERLDPDEEIEGYLPIPPDLAVEVVSPGDTWTEVEDKVEEYLSAGVKVVWVLDPKRKTVKVYPDEKTLRENDTLDGGKVLPGFAVPVWRLFRRRKP
jgi:Uma2 family endonuclease